MCNLRMVNHLLRNNWNMKKFLLITLKYIENIFLVPGGTVVYKVLLNVLLRIVLMKFNTKHKSSSPRTTGFIMITIFFFLFKIKLHFKFDWVNISRPSVTGIPMLTGLVHHLRVIISYGNNCIRKMRI